MDNKISLSENENFYIKGNVEYKRFAEDTLKYLNTKHKEILNTLQIEKYRKLQINIYSSLEETVTAKNSDVQKECIHIHMSKDEIKDITKYRIKIITIVHELVIYIQREIGIFSTWLVEGNAQNISGEKAGLKKAEIFERWLNLKINVTPNINVMNSINLYIAEKYNAYDYAYLMVRYMHETMTKDEIKKIMMDKEYSQSVEEKILIESVEKYKANNDFISTDVEIFNGVCEGQNRSDIQIGMKVKIVLKKDQKTGILTEGRVGRILTNSRNHHRGIKVMLEDGKVGRVQVIVK